jgi:hypothetical protein
MVAQLVAGYRVLFTGSFYVELLIIGAEKAIVLFFIQKAWLLVLSFVSGITKNGTSSRR